MKYLLVFLLSFLFGSNMSAQEVTYWVGRSALPDPIMRHHEAFMEAFLLYIQNRPKSEHGTIDEQVVQLCKIETVSSVTYDGQETLTIAIGSGTLAKYEYAGHSSKSENIAQDEMFLTIIYEDENLESAHEYRSHCVIDRSDSNQTPNTRKEFSYNCVYTHAKK